MLNAWTLNGPSAPLIGDGLRAAVASALAGDPAVSALVGTRVAYGQAVESWPTGACRCVYQVVSLTRPTAIDDPLTIQAARVQVALSGRGAADVVDAAEAVRLLLHGFAGTLGGLVTVRECRVEAERDLPEPPKDASDRWTHRTVIDVFVRYLEARP